MTPHDYNYPFACSKIPLNWGVGLLSRVGIIIVGDYGALTSGHSMQYAPSTIMFAKDSTGCTLCCVMASNVSSPNSDRDPSKSASESKLQCRFLLCNTC